MHEVQAGKNLVVSVPRNTFPLVEAPATLLVAGGIGITPILPMAAALSRRGARARLLYAGRSLDRMAFLHEVAQLKGIDVVIVPEDAKGRPELATFTSSLESAAVLACGPAGMLDALADVCEQRPPKHGVHIERFTLGPPPVPADAGSEPEFHVLLARTGVTLSVHAGDSILKTVRAAGVNVQSSCEQGVCGTCETRVLGGTIDHRDMLLSTAERDRGDTMMICVSRSAGDKLTLDL